MRSSLPSNLFRLTCAFVLLASNARAAVVIFQQGVSPSGSYSGLTDTWIRSDNPTFGGSATSTMLVGTVAGTGPNDLRSLYSINFNSLIPSNATIDAISFTLYTAAPDGVSVNRTLDLQLNVLSQSFVATSASWNNRQVATPWTIAGGTMGSVLSNASVSTTAVSGTSFTFASSSAFVLAAQSSLDTSTPLYLAMWAPIQEGLTDRAIINVNSSEAATVGFRPTLTISYTVIPEPSTVAMLALGAVGVLVVRERRRLSRVE